MTTNELADTIVIAAGVYWLAGFLMQAGMSIAEELGRAHARRRRMRNHKRWVAARKAAREETEARLRTEGRCDNYEIQDAMKAAGERAVPGYRPL